MTLEARSRDSQRQLVEGEFLFTEEDFGRIAKMLHDDAGIAIVESKATLVYSRLAKRLRASWVMPPLDQKTRAGCGRARSG